MKTLFRAPNTSEKDNDDGRNVSRKADRKLQSEFKVTFLEASLGENVFGVAYYFLFYFWKLENFHNSTVRLKSRTGEKLLGGSAELDLVVYPVGQV